ncbi:DUF7064 domain-containing protein [Flavisphingomonas formosensis]|uniref:DUF7064 domain-containing protein n=1 Tax=Flavisphingomonas formosensis TaxID=861534 RepID=UPI0012F9A9EA|nr:hypothetical protein [Sphingomonas formosensis]
MTTVHDDLPHPVPAFAQLRYKENYFFILIAPESGAFGVIHLNHEPGHDRARYTANFEIGGRSIRYANTTAFPDTFEYARTIGDGALTLHFAEPHQRFELRLESDAIDIALRFTARHPTFDYAACRTAGNAAPSFQEVMTLGLNLPYNHQQQALDVSGHARFVDGPEIAIRGSGYRDHSWVIRADAGALRHNWCGLNFPGRSFGIKTLETSFRPGHVAKEGYVVDADGLRALRRIEVHSEGEMPDGLCAKLVHEVTDVFGNAYRIESDVAGRFAHVPLVSEAPVGKVGFHIVENFCPLRLTTTGERGEGLVEIGRSSAIGGAYA